MDGRRERLIEIDLVAEQFVKSLAKCAQSMTPHPVIKTRFTTESQKPDLVNQLFDRGANTTTALLPGVSSGQAANTAGTRCASMGLRLAQRLLDVGCGTGLVALEAARILGTAENITCLDPNAGMLSVAKSKLKRAVSPGASKRDSIAGWII